MKLRKYIEKGKIKYTLKEKIGKIKTKEAHYKFKNITLQDSINKNY
jgi:hypothetical protein